MSSDDIRVTLDLFEGPLDLLLYLIRERHIDISAVSIARITDQYLAALELIQEMDLNVAGEYLVMAATLLLIKSRMLLPPQPSVEPDEEDEEDLRERLVERLKQYRLFREAGRRLKDFQTARDALVERPVASPLTQENITEWTIDATVVDHLKALKDVLSRTQEDPVHLIPPNPVSVREKMSYIMEILERKGTVLLSDLFRMETTKRGMIGVFLAILELIRMQAVHARQRTVFGEIRLALSAKIE